MSKGRELALLEKWADAAAGATLPPISPTSPKATKFCCCPNRRRYNIKQPKKSTLHARNIFLDNDFSFIDDVSSPLHSSNTNTGSDSTDNGRVAAAKTPPTFPANDCDYDVVDSAADRDGSWSATRKVSGTEQQAANDRSPQSRRIAAKSQWRHDQGSHNHSNSNNNSDSNSNSCSCSCPEQPTAASTPTVGVQYSNSEKSPSPTNTNAAAATNTTTTTTATTAIGHGTNVSESRGNDRANAAALAQTIKLQQLQQQQQHQQQRQEYDGHAEARNECRSNNNKHNNNNKSENSDQQIQRLSNSEFNCSNNKEENNIFRNNNNNNSNSNISQSRNCRLDSSTHDERGNSSESCTNTRNSGSNDNHQYNDDDANNNKNNADIANVDDGKIDLQNKMTITTTNAASRKRVECGLTSATTTATTTTATTTTTAGTMPATAEAAPTAGQAAMTMPTSTTTTTTTMATRATPSPSPSPTTAARPTTPSLTTVIKTTMVKRSPSNESATPCSSPTAKDANTAIVTAILSKFPLKADNALYGSANNNNTNNSSNKCDESTEPTRTIKQRIAALVAGNEQAKQNHDNSIKSPLNSSNSSSRHPSNMTTQAKSAINSLHYKQQQQPPPLISSKCPTAKTTTTTTTPTITTTITTTTASSVAAATLTEPSPATPSNSAPHYKSGGLSDMQRASLPATAATGYATMPRRRSPAERHGNAVRCGSINAAMTGDKKFLNDGGSGGGGGAGGDANGATATCRKLSTLDNLDLALKHDWTDDDGEDSYSAFQEYLEKVEHEINEVFEMRKARQRALQEEALDTVAPSAPNTASNDELTRSTESDSGCGSASGQQISSSSSSSCCNSGGSDSGHNCANAAAAISSAPVPTTTQLIALPPPPLSLNDNAVEATLRRRHHTPHEGAGAADTEANNEDVNVWAKKFLRDLDNLMSSSRPLSLSACSSPTSKTSPLLLSAAATAAIQSRYGKCAPADREQFNGLVLRPEKHTTIPLQSFNLDCGHLDNGGGSSNNDNDNDSSNNSSAAAKPTVAYMRTLSAPTPYHQQLPPPPLLDNKSGGGGGGIVSGQSERNSLAAFTATLPPHQQHYHNLTNLQPSDGAASAAGTAPSTAATTILKIEETAAGSVKRAQQQLAAATTTTAQVHDIDEELLKIRRQRQLDNDMETIRGARLSPSHGHSHSPSQSQSCRSSGCDKNTLVASTMATSLPKRERINHATATSTTTATMMTTTAPAGPTKPVPTTGNVAALLPSTLLTPSKANGGSGGGGSVAAGSLLLNGSDATKKGSTSTIWTSEESILRSVGAVDEDNNSTSSSACEEASGVLSSGKSGISLDSSGLDNDNNESGIGTATPPKDISYWKSAHNDNESVSSLDALRKMKFQKSSSVASSDDPDLLEVLSLCDEPHGEEDIGDDVDESHDDIDERQPQQLPAQQQRQQQQQQQKLSAADKQQKQLSLARPSRHRPRQQLVDSRVGDGGALEAVRNGVVDLDEEDEGHDEFETVPFYDCDCNDGDASSASGSGTGGGTGGGSGRTNSTASGETSGVLLRRKLNGTPLLVPPKCRSHSLDTATLPATYYHHHYHQHNHQHQLPHQHQHHQHQHGHPPLTRKLQHLQGRTKERGQLSLTLRQEPFTSLLSPTQFNELPSPSSASLHSGHESLGIQELTTKSNSAPLLLKQEKKRDDFAGQKSALRYSRSQSDRYLAEIEAVESCKWLRAAGFPQYAQMYEDHQFPIDLAGVAKDHTNLENDQLQSLYRRLCILNRCANMRIDQSHKAQTPQQKEDSDDENFALSENWTFQPHIRRWSRIGEMGLEIPPAGQLNIEKTESSSKESSPDRFEDDQYDMSTAALALNLSGDGTDTALNDAGDGTGVRLRRTGSERFKDGAKAFLRRVESIKSRRRKRQNREGMVISGPQALDLSQLGQRHSARKPDAVYSTPPSPSAVSPMHTFPKGPMFGNELKVPSQSENYLSPNRASPKRTPTTPRSMRTSPLHFFSNPMPHLREGKSDDSSSYYSDSQESSTGGKLALRKTPSKTRRFLQRTGKVDDIGAHSDSECHQGRKLLIKDANSNTTEVKIKKLTRGGSLNLGKDPKKREGIRSSSVRSRSTSRKETKTEDTDNVKRAPVVRWHSFQMEERPHMIFRKCFSQKIEPSSKDHGLPFAAMSAGQLQILRKLALVILTGQMENHCPSHRSGWNWELPKFIKKIKMPDYKDKKVFGVPLLLVLQRTGQTLPVAIRAAFRWLQVRALDQVGLFRKSGVKSRIIKLKADIENLDSTAQCMEVFDMQQAYDVADMLKQYFRDLPESLLTTKMSETFATIFQHLPKDVRLEAVQCAVLLLPDENREILYALLEFLTLVAANAEYNQMTANNLAVCLAPSLFHSSISTGSTSVTASPRRRKGAGVPDDKELLEAKASHECLAFMIENYKQIYTASKEKINKCNFGYMEESKPVPLEALGEGMQFHNWRGYLYECTSATIKEGREKTRGWIAVTSLSDSNVDIAYKKVGDGHPLRLWRCITEVEGPPKEVLDYIIKQRASWDPNLLECQTVKKLDERTEIFQYAMDGQFTTDFCVLRSWQTDLPRGACVIVETSIDHAKAKPMFGAIRGVVLASRYLIEPCGSGRSRVMHLARVDIKGRSPEWYNRSYGHICSHYLSRIRLAFKNVTDGPESKV